MNDRLSIGRKGRESGMPEEAYWESFFNPACILELLGCSGSCGDVVEFGCGYGTFTVPAAKMTTGRVYAIDIDPEMVATTARRARVADLNNIIAQVRDFVTTGCGRPDGSAGYVMLFNILHIENPVALLREARRVLRPGGSVGIIHWRTDVATPRGPSLDIRPTAEQCRFWGETAELQYVRDDSLNCCSWHWGLVMKRP